MAKLNVIKPTLKTPEGINNYSGEIFRCFTKGDTIPFKFTFKQPDGSACDVNGWKVMIVFSSAISCETSECGDTAVTVEVEIPLTDDEAAIFEGEVSDIKTQSLPCGIVYAMAKYVTATEQIGDNVVDGASHIIDMCRLEVYPNITTIMH